ncbi:helix-turn-helix domain-containing protein [Shewanella goraebulensis]|uniref:helix-turn-helix domain-containing protein n=1 Tax=Shewanella goraebulensis TaxID=3050637 RepID=UPI00254F0353|nr:helix-turn-helix domain-containing protein [Shewanella goraebulensis]
MSKVNTVKSIAQLHRYLGLPSPLHPLITVIPQSAFQGKVESGSTYAFELYQISLKQGIECTLNYGRNTYDFNDGSMVFIAPGQSAVASDIEIDPNAAGWTIAFHPDLISRSDLGKKMDQYTFFNYESNESLHLSAKEIELATDISEKIEFEYSQNMDRHTQSLLLSNLELLLNYCVRFYDRQFYVRADLNRDYLGRFEAFLNSYYLSNKPLERGVPTVQYCGQELGLSPYYLSDLLKRETGKTALEYIHLFLIERSKSLMLEDKLSISQIACDLGFEYPQHFSKLFKSKTGMSPRTFKSSSQIKH